MGLASERTADWIAGGERILRELEKELHPQAMSKLDSTILRSEVRFKFMTHRDPNEIEAAVDRINAAFPDGIILPPLKYVKLQYGADPHGKLEEWWVGADDKHGHAIFRREERQ